MSPMRTPARAGIGVASVAALSAMSTLAATCSGTAEPAVGVGAVVPSSAYNDGNIELVIQGGPFRPAYDIDTSAGSATTQRGAFAAYLTPHDFEGPRVAVDSLTWLGPSALAATLRPGIPAGTYDVAVIDPRGALAELPKAFSSLGSDVTPPSVKILGPQGGTIVNPTAEVPVAFSASDSPGTLAVMRWTVSSPGITPLTGTCPVGPSVTQSTCQFVFVVPQPLLGGQPLNINVSAKDAAGNEGLDVTTLAVGLPPKVTKFLPTEGPAQGGTDITVEGDDFITGTQVLMGGVPIEPGGGTVMDPHHITGRTPIHDPGLFPVVVRTGGASAKADGNFLFVAAPVVLAVSPPSGPTSGGTAVSVVGKGFREATSLRFGSDFGTAAPLLCATLVSPNRIQGYLPPGAGAVSIFALDPVSGTSERPLAFTYLSEDSPDGSSLAVPPCLAADGGAP